MSDVPALKFKPTDVVHNLTTGQTRIVRQINEMVDGDDMLLVRKDEDDEKSILFSWRAASCDLVFKPVVTFDVHDKVYLGSGNVVREVLDTRIHRSTGDIQYRVDVEGEKEKWVYALALRHADSVAHKMKATDELPTSSDPAQVDDEPTPDYIKADAMRDILARTDAEVDEEDLSTLRNDNYDSLQFKLQYATARAQFEPQFRQHVAEIKAEIERRDRIAAKLNLIQSLDDLPLKPAGADADALFRASQELAREQELRADAEERARVAELNNKKLQEQVKMLEGVVTRPVTAQLPCLEVKSQMFRVGHPDHDKQYTDMLNEGWKESSVTSVINSGDTIWSVVIFKRMVDAPSQPTRGTAGHHAALTNPFQSPADYQRQPTPNSVEILEPVTSKIKLGPIGTAIKEQGVEETIFTMNEFALQGALNRAKERIDATPAFNMRPLLAVKAGE